MLLNPGFEIEWSGSHRCFVFQDDGSYYETDIGNIFTPDGWVVWFKHNDTFAQPEVTDAWKNQDERRVHSGEKACHLFTFGKLHDGGLLQQVQVTPGSMVTFTIYAQAWSNHKGKIEDFPHPDDGKWSEGTKVGYNEIALDQVPELNGDPQNDANGNIAFTVGIDPTGGVDPYASSVVWSDVLYSYNKHHLLAIERVKAQSDIITVFTRSITLWPFKHNDVYWDDAELIVSDAPPEPPGECPGEPRVDYERTYVLMPPGATVDDVKFIVDETWEHNRFTVGGSADDAGIGNLSKKQVLAVQPSLWGNDLQGFFDDWYNDPPVEYWPLEYENDYQKTGRILAYSLRANGFTLSRPTTHDELIITDEFGAPRDGWTHNGLDIRSSHSAWDDEIISATDGEVIEAGWHNNSGGYGWRVRVKTISPDGRELHIRYAHLVENSVTVSIGDTIHIGDLIGLPGGTGGDYLDHLHIDVFAVERAHYVDPSLLIEPWNDEPQPPPPPPPSPIQTSTIGLHVQVPSADNTGFGDVQFCEMVKPSVMKLVLNMEHARHYKAVSPETKVVYRQWVPWQDYYKNPDLEKAAWDFLKTFLDSLLANVDYIDYAEGLNEVALQCGFVDPRFIEFERQFAIALTDATNGRVKPCLGGIAVGNPEHRPTPDLELMIPMVEASIEYGGAIGYHGYVHCVNGIVDWDAEYHYSMRALLSYDPYYTSLGLYPSYIHTETGVFVNAKDGWRKSNCLNGDKAAYVTVLNEFDRRCKLTPAGLQGRFVGNTIFTANAGRDDWRYYDIHPDYKYFAENLK